MSFYTSVLSEVLYSIESKPSNNAFCIDEEHYTYEYFGQCIAQIRHALRHKAHASKEVGLVINDDIQTYASIFALWLEGEAYVPLHPNWPLERCLDICDQVGLDLVVDSSETSRYEGVPVLDTSSLDGEGDNLEPVTGIAEDALAYILFTSGSTGKPKGVQIMRKNVAAFMDSFWDTGIEITDNDRCLQCFDLSFDVSVQGYLVPLTRGACCYTVPHGQIKYVYVSGLIEDHQLTFGAMAPSMLRYLRPYFEEIDASSLKTCILTAEACPLDLVEAWYECACNTEIYNFYGPTECTIYCTYYKLHRDGQNKKLNGSASIGRALSQCVSLIIDENGNECAPGEKGELCIAGDQVTKGYWNNEEKNASSFFNRQVGDKTLRFYHTGDLCMEDADGDLLLSGRMDHQVKIQGFRVEMGEIEFHAREFMNGADVVCLAFENAEKLTEIAMFIESKEFDTTDLISFMRSRMPSYMIPTRIYCVPVFPLNLSEKTDKVKLKSMIK